MNQIVICFVPVNATQQNFESALRERVEAATTREAAPQQQTERAGFADNDELPLWMWFLPGARR